MSSPQQGATDNGYAPAKAMLIADEQFVQFVSGALLGGLAISC